MLKHGRSSVFQSSNSAVVLLLASHLALMGVVSLDVADVVPGQLVYGTLGIEHGDNTDS